jgi:hypothetical protein
MLLLLQLLLQLLLVLPHRWPAVASPPPPRPPAAAAAAAAAAELAPVANFSARRGHYSYAWDVVEHNTTRYMFYCGNHDGDFVIRDSVMYRKGAKQPDGRWVFGEERLALPHGGPDSHRDPLPPRGCANEPWPGGACVWDKQHACDRLRPRGHAVSVRPVLPRHSPGLCERARLPARPTVPTG